MKRYVALFDIIFYVVFPLIVWHWGRGILGDYYAMLLSSVPGIIYSVYRFYEIKKFNVFGIFMLGTLVIGTTLDILAGSAIQLLWNNVFYAYALSLLFLVTIIMKKPIALYFGLDLMELQGMDRNRLKPLLHKRKIFLAFIWITLAFCLRDIVQATFKIWLIQQYGVEAFDKGIIARQVISWGTSALTVIGFVYIAKQLQEEGEFRKMIGKSTEGEIIQNDA